MNSKKQTRIVWGINIGFWLLLVVLLSMALFKDNRYPDAGYFKHFLQILMGVGLILVPGIYVNTLVLIPRFLAQKKYVYYLLGILGLVGIWTPIAFYLDNWLDVIFFDHDEDELQLSIFPQGFAVLFMVMAMSTFVNLSYRWFFQLNKIVQLENEHLNTELVLLKNQINPHFFFNTLHNLYSLALVKSDDAPQVILKLSDMMRYTIYDCKEKQVLLTQEIEYLQNYISLQKIRLHERGSITFNIDIIDERATIAPLLLIVFLENAFKHGLETLTNGAYIKVTLKADEHLIRFRLENNYDAEERHSSGGVGLENVHRRLDLLYGTQYQLDISDEQGVYKVDLYINN
ncbi:MAG TPA: hypothetical protein DCS93_10915 [Microscillaceae bacterium]|nr:hypothetical protein [Microscillaceae bacterium]